MNEVEVNGNDVLYIGADVHERETQLAIFEPGGTLLQEKRIPTKDLQSYIELELTPESESDQFLVLSNATQDAPWKVADDMAELVQLPSA
jgi:predicted NBD/HSP70 family sugar kinase